jgi:hypothetical protein
MSTKVNNKYTFEVYEQGKTFQAYFKLGDNTLTLDNISYYPELSQETTCYKADMVINGVKIGFCKNDGNGGCADFYFNQDADTESIFNFIKEIKVQPNFVFPMCVLMFEDVLDVLSDLNINIRNVKTKKMLKEVLKDFSSLWEIEILLYK